MAISRRGVLAFCGLMPLGIMMAGGARAQEAACGGAPSLSLLNRRRALGYVEKTPDPKRACGLCAYFTAGAGGCGACQMLSGAAVSSSAVCNSFVKKP